MLFRSLTPEHGFPSLSYKVQGAPPQPAAGIPRLLFSHPFLQKAQKNRRHLHRMPPEKVPISTTSSGGIIRIRFKGRRSTFLSACHTSSRWLFSFLFFNIAHTYPIVKPPLLIALCTPAGDVTVHSVLSNTLRDAQNLCSTVSVSPSDFIKKSSFPTQVSRF